MSAFIVSADGLDPNAFAQLSKIEGFDVHPSSKVSQEELKGLLPKVTGLIIRSSTNITQELISQAPNLKYIIRAGEGTDNIDKKQCQEKGIKVSNTPGANGNSAAEHAIALIMTLLRKTAWAHSSMEKGAWDKALYAGNELTGKTVGIIGFGKIGQILAKRISGFEPKVLYYDPFVKTPPFEFSKSATLQEIFSKADVITVHTPLMDATRNLIHKDLFKLMKQDAIFVNAARGGIVNEDDLAQALEKGLLKAAALDVFAEEPLPADSKLRSLSNLILTPHLGASTAEAAIRVGDMAVNQMSEYLNHNNLLNEVRS